MGSGASSASSQTGSNPNVNHCSGNESRKTSTIQSKKHSSSAGFIMLSYEPTHTPLGRKHGFIKEGFPEHGLIQDRYFLIKDHFKGIDKLRTTDKFGAPNFRKAQGSYPVYGMGQPTRDGLGMVIQTLLENGHKVSCFALFSVLVLCLCNLLRLHFTFAFTCQQLARLPSRPCLSLPNVVVFILENWISIRDFSALATERKGQIKINKSTLIDQSREIRG